MAGYKFKLMKSDGITLFEEVELRVDAPEVIILGDRAYIPAGKKKDVYKEARCAVAAMPYYVGLSGR